MSDKLYAIQDSTLTALGDILREKTEKKYTTVDEPTMEPFFTATLDTDLVEPNYTYSSDYYYEVPIDFPTLLGDMYDYTKRLYIEYEYEVNKNVFVCDITYRSDEQYKGSQGFIAFLFDRNSPLSGTGSKYGHIGSNEYNQLKLIVSSREIEDGATAKVSVKIWACDANDKFIDLNKYTPLEMVDAINSLDTKPPLQDIVIDTNGTYSADEGYYGIGSVEVNTLSIPDEALNLTGNCQYRFAYGSNDWLINMVGDKITTKDIANANYMFSNSKVKYIPFEINMTTGALIESIFDGCNKLKEVPVINMPSLTYPINFRYNFRDCYSIREVPEWFCNLLEQSYNSGSNTNLFSPFESVFQNCRSLRKMPEKVMKYMAINGTTSGYYYTMAYGNPFRGCASLNELVGISCDDYNFTSNQFSYFFSGLYRAKNITFQTNEDGTPMIRNWQSQTIDLSSYIGYGSPPGDYIGYNSGITADKEVKDDATYQALKNDPDWYSKDINYSRYNHDSAVNTINSLPDCSASGGTNTIKFKGAAGALTDGGAINTLTDAEIAVAAAKGWTVSLV